MNITEQQLDALKEIFNIGLGYGVNSLNTLLSSHIEMYVPHLDVLTFEELVEFMNHRDHARLSAVNMGFRGPFQGSASLVFPQSDIAKIVQAIMPEHEIEEEFISSYSGVMTEIGNIVLNGIMGTVSNLFSTYFSYIPPIFMDISPDELFFGVDKTNAIVIFAEAHFLIEKLDIHGNIMILLEVGSFEKLLQLLTATYRELLDN